MATLTKKNIYLGKAYGFRDLVYFYQGKKHVSMQTDMLFKKKLRVQHLDQPAGGDCVTQLCNLHIGDQ